MGFFFGQAALPHPAGNITFCRDHQSQESRGNKRSQRWLERDKWLPRPGYLALALLCFTHPLLRRLAYSLPEKGTRGRKVPQTQDDQRQFGHQTSDLIMNVRKLTYGWWLWWFSGIRSNLHSKLFLTASTFISFRWSWDVATQHVHSKSWTRGSFEFVWEAARMRRVHVAGWAVDKVGRES